MCNTCNSCSNARSFCCNPCNRQNTVCSQSTYLSTNGCSYNRCSLCGCGFQYICRDCCGNIWVNNRSTSSSGCYHNGNGCYFGGGSFYGNLNGLSENNSSTTNSTNDNNGCYTYCSGWRCGRRSYCGYGLNS